MTETGTSRDLRTQPGSPGALGGEPGADRCGDPCDPHPLIFFDGVCGMCNRFVDFVIARDSAQVFRFAPWQGDTARSVLPPPDVRGLDSMVLLDRGTAYRKSAAVVRVVSRFGGAWRLAAGVLWLIPKPLRDVGYSLIARYRYRLFGKKETCRMPTASERARFLP